MRILLLLAGRLGGLLGLVACAVAVGMRLSGEFWMGGFQLGTVLQGGVAAMVAGCFLLLWGMSMSSPGVR